MAIKLSFFILISIFLSHINAETIICKEERTCSCSSKISGETCTLNCNKDDVCKEQIINCRDGDPCEINCSAKSACSSGVIINAETATDVTIICAKDDSCKDDITINCGTGHCNLQCNSKTSCESFGSIDLWASESFECSGGNCPDEVPAPYTAETNPNLPGNEPEPKLPGYYGQECAFGIDDNPPDECKSVGDVLTGRSKIECGENFDCCLCKSMICGNPSSGGCDELNCNGDSGCYGVRDIRLYGSRGGGVTLSCNGDESCFQTKITGTNIKEIICSGDEACARATFEFDCIAGSPCVVSCGGSGACAGTRPETGRLSTFFKIGNTEGIECDTDACKYGVFHLQNNFGGEILCSGTNACLGAEITINNIEALSCGASNACKDARILVINPKSGFNIECSGMNSCIGLTLEIVLTNGNNIGSIECGDGGCVGANIAIYNEGNGYVTVSDLNCEAPSSCTGASFDFEGGVGFASCKCGEESMGNCDGITGIDSCMAGVDKIECSGVGACFELQQQVVNVANGFELKCNDRASCKGFWLQIVLNDNGRSKTNYLKGYDCGDTYACSNAIIQLNNEQKGITVTIEKINCDGDASCENALFIIDGEVNIKEIVCGDDISCFNCMVQHSSQNMVEPCTSFYDDS